MEHHHQCHLRCSGNFIWQERKNWFNAILRVIETVCEARRESLLAHKHCRREKTLSAVRSARSITQRPARRCANSNWMRLYENIQSSACGNVCNMSDDIKMAVGRAIGSTAPRRDNHRSRSTGGRRHRALYRTLLPVWQSRTSSGPERRSTCQRLAVHVKG